MRGTFARIWPLCPYVERYRTYFASIGPLVPHTRLEHSVSYKSLVVNRIVCAVAPKHFPFRAPRCLHSSDIMVSWRGPVPSPKTSLESEIHAKPRELASSS